MPAVVVTVVASLRPTEMPAVVVTVVARELTLVLPQLAHVALQLAAIVEQLAPCGQKRGTILRAGRVAHRLHVLPDLAAVLTDLRPIAADLALLARDLPMMTAITMIAATVVAIPGVGDAGAQSQ